MVQLGGNHEKMGRVGGAEKKGKRGQIGADAEPARFFHSAALREHRLDRTPLESCASYIFTSALYISYWELYKETEDVFGRFNADQLCSITGCFFTGTPLKNLCMENLG